MRAFRLHSLFANGRLVSCASRPQGRHVCIACSDPAREVENKEGQASGQVERLSSQSKQDSAPRLLLIKFRLSVRSRLHSQAMVEETHRSYEPSESEYRQAAEDIFISHSNDDIFAYADEEWAIARKGMRRARSYHREWSLRDWVNEKNFVKHVAPSTEHMLEEFEKLAASMPTPEALLHASRGDVDRVKTECGCGASENALAVALADYEPWRMSRPARLRRRHGYQFQQQTSS